MSGIPRLSLGVQLIFILKPALMVSDSSLLPLFCGLGSLLFRGKCLLPVHPPLHPFGAAITGRTGSALTGHQQVVAVWECAMEYLPVMAPITVFGAEALLITFFHSAPPSASDPG